MRRVLAIVGLVVAAGVVAGVAAAGLLALRQTRADAAAPATTRPALHTGAPGRLRPTPHAPAPRLVAVAYPQLSTGMSGQRVLRLQELLAMTGYLPLSFSANGPARISPLAARAGEFRWRFRPSPALAAGWEKGEFGVVTQGAVMTFEARHGLSADGVAGPLVWKALIADAHHGHWSHTGYSYAYVSETLPESITIYRNGRAIFRSPANTGIPQAPTQQGTWPVYLRFTSTTMKGINPDGSHYDDPGIPWVSYFHGGDAVHGFLRASYGSPQSLGCVELPYAEAQQAYGLMTYGTLVTVGG